MLSVLAILHGKMLVIVYSYTFYNFATNKWQPTVLSTMMQVLGKIFVAYTHCVYVQNIVLADLQNELLCLERLTNRGQGVFPLIKLQNRNTCFQCDFKNNKLLLEWVSSSLSGAV